MNSVFLRLLILFAFLASGTIQACAKGETCIEKSRWHLGLAMGLGVKTNPLVDGDNIPLLILPDIAWYSDNAYFDNGELGYQWMSQSTFAFESFLQIDRERAFFSFWHPANFLLPSEGLSTASPDFPAIADPSNEDIKVPQPSLSIDQIASRKWAVNAGIRGHYYLSNGEWQFTFQQDISQVHRGHQLRLAYQHRWNWHSFRLGLRLGSDWKSDALIDYYYGVSQRDTDLSEFYFKGQSGWQPFIAINLQKPINEHWSWLANMGYRRLPSSLSNSPLIEQNNIRNLFLGVAYRF